MARRCDAWVGMGGLFGSINHDTYDEHEDVAYAVGYRVLSGAARLLDRSDLRDVALERCPAALAYFEAAREHGGESGMGWQRDGLTILRAASKHHHGPHGFLTEGVDWNNHVGSRHHFDGRACGDIRCTEPFLNNLHILEPTVYYLRHLARREESGPGGEHHPPAR